jgi:ABC-2 type transport system ATP-binding protein
MTSAGRIGPAALELRGISKTYGRGSSAKHAVADVSLIVRAGEVYGFLGPNGAGKSTTIRMALGLIRPSSGQIVLFGDEAPHRKSLARVGSLVDGGAFYPFLTGRDNLRVLARTRGIDGERIEALLEEVELAKDADRKVKGYSLGMKQRLGVAAALLNDPDLVILDEPANGLDAAGIQDMRRLIRGLAERGKAVFLSSHLLHEVEQICDRVAIVAKGRLLQEAGVREMLGGGEALWIEAEPVEAGLRALEATWAVALMDGGLRVRARREDTPAVLRRLQEAGVDVFQIGGHKQSLEHIFLDMTRDDDA